MSWSGKAREGGLDLAERGGGVDGVASSTHICCAGGRRGMWLFDGGGDEVDVMASSLVVDVMQV